MEFVMSVRSRRIVPLYVAAALTGVSGGSLMAIAQTMPPPAVAEADRSPVTRSDLEPVQATQPASAAPSAAVPADSTAAPSSSQLPTEASAATTAEATHPASITVDVSAALARVPNIGKFDKRDRDALIKAYTARQGRPIWITEKGAIPAAFEVAAEIMRADDWGLAATEFAIPTIAPVRDVAAALTADAISDADVQLSLAVLKYARHARGGRFEPTDLTPFLDRQAPSYAPETILAGIAEAPQRDAYLRKLHPQHRQFELLRQRYLAVRGEIVTGKAPSEADRLLANMEQWRWMPTDLGDFHVWVSVPEQTFRVVRNGRTIHSERAIVGRVNAQTPIFSHEMKFLVFHPFWGIPNSIKNNDVLPSLQRGGAAALQRKNMRLQLNGKDVDPSRYDWRRTDIRRFHVYQPPGRGNALGVVKFMFPNKHDVYLHDTPTKALFKQSARVISAGCVRVQDPLQLAEILLGEDRGMPASEVRALARPGAPENNQVHLSRRIPVHITYFTMHVDESGKVASHKDVYGHEERIRLALAGKMHLIQPVPQPVVPTTPIGRAIEVASPYGESLERSGSSSPAFSNTRPAWARQVFSGSGGSFSGGN